MPLSNYLPSSRLIQPGVCTSTTRPASPYEGQAIYETDTDKVLVWNGAAWYANWNLPWGMVKFVSSTSATYTFTASGEVDLTATGSFTAVANRRYKVHAECYGAKSTAAGNMYAWLTDGPATSASALQTNLTSMDGGYGLTMHLLWTGTLSAGSHDIYLRVGVSNNGAVFDSSSTQPTVITVEDVGPA
jgi:hypothetical protein